MLKTELNFAVVILLPTKIPVSVPRHPAESAGKYLVPLRMTEENLLGAVGIESLLLWGTGCYPLRFAFRTSLGFHCVNHFIFYVKQSVHYTLVMHL